ncbi:MAG: hypothetical protein FWG92_05165 [Leptospirales bacterium]|nr:hypothetical protein [Leptospirales bacterium]
MEKFMQHLVDIRVKRKVLNVVGFLILAVFFSGIISVICLHVDIQCLSLNASPKTVLCSPDYNKDHNSMNHEHTGFSVFGHCCHGCVLLFFNFGHSIYFKGFEKSPFATTDNSFLPFLLPSGIERPPRL